MEYFLNLVSRFGQNIALALSLTLLYSLIKPYLSKINHLLQAGLIGCLFGSIALLSSFSPAEIIPDLSVNGRVVFLGLAGPMGGPAAAIAALTIQIIFDLALPGFSPSTANPGSLLSATLIGIGLYFFNTRSSRPSRSLEYRMFFGLGLLLAISELLWSLSSRPILEINYLKILPLFIIYILAVFFTGVLLSYESRRHDFETALRTEKERLSVTIRSIGEAVITTDEEGKVILINEEAQALTGYSQQEAYQLYLLDVFNIVNSTTREPNSFPIDTALREGIIAAGAAGKSALVSKNGSMRSIDYIVSSIKENNHQPLGVVLVFRDITNQIESEEQLKASVREKEVLLKEIHHRVKNNLQVVYSLLDHQSEFVKDPEAFAMFIQSRSRIRSMAMIHEQLYQSKDLANIDFSEYIENLVVNLKDSFGSNAAVKIITNVESVTLGVYMGIPCGLIINELVSNAMKYAFPEERAGQITIELKYKTREDIQLSVADNGVGLSKDLDFQNAESLGLQLVNMLTKQLKGSIELNRDQGTEFQIIFTPSKLKRI